MKESLVELLQVLQSGNKFAEVISILYQDNPEALQAAMNSTIGGYPNTIEIREFTNEGYRTYAFDKNDPHFLEMCKANFFHEAMNHLVKCFPNIGLRLFDCLAFVTVLCNAGVLKQSCVPVQYSLPKDRFYTVSIT